MFTVLPLLKALDVPLIVTTTTPTGAAVLLQQKLPHVRHYYLPVDFPGACQRFFNSVKIRDGWIVETEIWPWLYAKAKLNHISLTIINARLSDKTSSQANGWLASTYRQSLSDVNILARSSDDARKFVELGATPETISTVGNLKYANPDADKHPVKVKRLIDRPYCLAASTHEDEELQLSIEWCKQQDRSATDVALVIVPRHPERGAAIQKQLATRGIHSALRSRKELLRNDHTIYIADTLGELQVWYAHARAGFIGGSLIKRGGHNMLEAARLGCPIVVGPHTFNFDDIVRTLHDHDALIIADNVQHVVAFFKQALDNRNAHTSMAEQARKQAQISEGVLDDYLKILLPG